MLRLPKPETRETVRENSGEETENETRSFYTPTKYVTSNSTQNNDTDTSRNMVTNTKSWLIFNKIDVDITPTERLLGLKS